MNRRFSAALGALLVVSATPALAQETAADAQCATIRPAFPRGFAGWSTRVPLAAGMVTRNAPVLAIGRGADLRLAGADRFTPAATPGKVADADALAGLALFQIARAGTYRVALGSGAWVDVVRGGRALAASAHGHGPMCTGIRKIVDFHLTPGRYVLQITGSRDATVPVLIARTEA
jgi:hypothetical protein